MTLVLPIPGAGYDRTVAVKNKTALEQEDIKNRKKGTDVELGSGERLIMRSPNGARWSITVGNTGTITAVAL